MSISKSLFIAFVWALPCLAARAESPLPTAAPEAVGMSTERLARVDEFIERMQRENKVAGAVTLIARHGKLVSLKAHGFADLESRRAMRGDDLFQLQSMTKPIATVAALQLMERGLLQLADPVSKFLPEFSDMKVAVERPNMPGAFDLVPVVRPMTILDLMTHRAGFVGVPPRDSPAARLRREAVKSLPEDDDLTLERYVTHLAASPLDMQPGAAFRYGPATVVLGRVIEVITGKTLDVALREQVFLPLGMTDTFFAVPEAKQARVASPYAVKPGQGLVRVPIDPMNPRFLSAGGNLIGTAADYFRFCQMLLNGGEFNGTRLLSRKSVELMTANQVENIPLIFLPGQYFGLGVAVGKADGQTGLLGSPGTFGWSGGYNTYFRIDPQEKIIILLFAQVEFSPFDLELQYGFHNTAMQAIAD
jgi:CubicO group peptidase (beta-lactamase class C family)